MNCRSAGEETITRVGSGVPVRSAIGERRENWRDSQLAANRRLVVVLLPSRPERIDARRAGCVLLVDFAADSRSAVPSIRENFTDVRASSRAYARFGIFESCPS